jgi:hypothetical protein
VFAFVPESLRKTEKDIKEELNHKSLNVFFEIVDYNPKTQEIKYNLVGKKTQEVPAQAKTTVDKHLLNWKEIYTTKK